MNQAAQLVQTLTRVAGAIPPDLSPQLAAVRSETQETRSAAAQVRTAATSAGATVTAAAQQFATVTAQAREWHTALTAAMEQIARTLQAAERSARASHERAASMVTGLTWRVWATASTAPVALVLLLMLVLWAADPLRASVAEWLMTDEQRNHVLNGAAIERAYQSPRATVVDRCRGVAAPGAVPGPAARERVERVDPADPQARQVAEAALRSAERQSALHQQADAAREAHGQALGRLFRDPQAAVAARDRMARTIGADVAADTLRRSPQAFGALTAEGAEAMAREQGRELTATIEGTGARWQAAERERPRTPAAQAAAELQRAQLGMEPFRAFDRAQVQGKRSTWTW